ncbi:MAG: hypothetical protein FJW66_06935 [Actinobacteria bacterium]|nr:hypothetical protein [Actinomycetota bacterium]
MKRRYAGIILAIFILAIAVIFLTAGCKNDSIAFVTSDETTSLKETTAPPETTTTPETNDIPETTAASPETEETVAPQVIAEKITIVGAEMTGAIPSFMCINKKNLVTIEVKNTSDFTWRTEIPNLVRFGYHFYGQDVSFTEYGNTLRTVLPHDVKPGETATVNVEINDVVNKGNYVIQIDMVQEANDDPANNFWFSSKGVAMVEGHSYFGACQQ